MEPVMFVMVMLLFMGWYISHETGKRLAVVRRQQLIVENGIRRRQAIRRAAARRRALLRRIALASTDGESLARYGRINVSVPILTKFFDEDQDLRPDFRLSRREIRSLLRMLPNMRDHGWGYTLDVLTFVYWLACGTSYRVVSEVFAVPRSTVHRMVHAIADDLISILLRVIHLPETGDLEAIGEGFCRLAGHSAFRKAVGAIDGCHIRLKPPEGVTRQ
ncbi:uncharacterized protein LOC135258585 [Anguilla rostrata]|uniref:uncharacterized protein LOC135258585 n=1 Tax=Anguilla rostrata TaxID=7938 RepID=UPI0030CCFAF9